MFQKRIYGNAILYGCDLTVAAYYNVLNSNTIKGNL